MLEEPESRGERKKKREGEREGAVACDYRNITGNFLEEFDRFLYRSWNIFPRHLFFETSREAAPTLPTVPSAPTQALIHLRGSLDTRAGTRQHPRSGSSLFTEMRRSFEIKGPENQTSSWNLRVLAATALIFFLLPDRSASRANSRRRRAARRIDRRARERERERDRKRKSRRRISAYRDTRRARSRGVKIAERDAVVFGSVRTREREDFTLWGGGGGRFRFLTYFCLVCRSHVRAR